MTWPSGIRSAAVACGIKPESALDLGVLVVDEPSVWAGTFTRNAAAAACVGWSRSLLGGSLRAVVVNSGNANACTGEAGVAAVDGTAGAVAQALGCDQTEVAVASTGPIGVLLPVDRITSVVPEAVGQLTDEIEPFAQAIMTTDSMIKSSRFEGDGFSVVGVAKGAAMLAPNMATMLAFLATDAVTEGDSLQKALSAAVSRSFDRICVDACESTNDSVFALASGHGARTTAAELEEALELVCRDLAEQMVADAEGGSKVVRIQVVGARDEETGVALGRGVASSALWRAAVHGEDPNWGRVLSALGAIDRDLELGYVSLWIGNVCVFEDGSPTGATTSAVQEMKLDAFTVRCEVGPAPTSVEILTTDLSPEYVTLNATGTS